MHHIASNERHATVLVALHAGITGCRGRATFKATRCRVEPHEVTRSNDIRMHCMGMHGIWQALDRAIQKRPRVAPVELDPEFGPTRFAPILGGAAPGALARFGRSSVDREVGLIGKDGDLAQVAAAGAPNDCNDVARLNEARLGS